MRFSKILLLIIGILIVNIYGTLEAMAASNDFSAILSVSDTHVIASTTVVSTITVTNLDNTYGADIAISYKGSSIASFYLGAGKSKSVNHSVQINATTDIVYTIYASHGPDISKTKNTNTVRVYVEQPATPTPTHTPGPTPKPTKIPTPTHTIIPTPATTPVSSEVIDSTSTNTVEIEYINSAQDSRTGWGEPINRPVSPKEVLDDLFKISMSDWLGINVDDIDAHTYQETYRIRRIILGISMLLVLSILVLIIAITAVIKRKEK